MILVDTSVWVDHLRLGDALLAQLLEENAVLMHPYIVGEIACGSLTNRAATLDLLQQMPMAAVAEHDELLGYIEHHKLHGKGIGYVDIHLLASTAITSATLWTRDKRLHQTAMALNLAMPPAEAH